MAFDTVNEELIDQVCSELIETFDENQQQICLKYIVDVNHVDSDHFYKRGKIDYSGLREHVESLYIYFP